MKNKYKFDPNSRNQQRKRAKENALNQQKKNEKSGNTLKKKNGVLAKKIVSKKLATNGQFRASVQSQIHKSIFMEALSDTLNPFTANTVTEAILSLYQVQKDADESITTSVGTDSFKLSQQDMNQLWEFIGVWCTEVANDIWVKHQEILVNKYKSINDARVIACLIKSYYGPNEMAINWCTEALNFIFHQPSEKQDVIIAESFLCMLRPKSRELTQYLSTYLKQKAETYTASASKRDWLRLLSILNTVILHLPSNDVVYFSKLALKLLIQSSPAEVQQVSLSVLDVLLRVGLGGDENSPKPLPLNAYFQITANLLKCTISQNSTIGSTLAQYFCKIVKDAAKLLNIVDPSRTIQEILPTFFVKMLQYLRVAENNTRNDAVANVACKCIEEIVQKCFTDEMISVTAEMMQTGSSESNIITNLITAIEGTFSVEFKSQLPRILQMIQVIYSKFKRSSRILLQNVLLKVDELYKLNDDSLTFYIERTFGAAAKYMGVEAFLEILPLGKRPDPRLWMFKILHSRIANNSFKLYQKEFFSKIKNLEKKIVNAQQKGDNAEVARFMKLNDEIWALMIDFLIYPVDMNEEIMKELVQMWINIFKSIPRRRSIACRSLMRLIQTNLEYIQFASGEDLPRDAAISMFKDAIVDFSVDRSNYVLQLVANHATELFPALFTLFTTVSSQNDVSLRDLVGVTITTLSSISNTKLVSDCFKLILVKMLKSGQESDEEHKQQRLVMLDLAGALSPYLDDDMSNNFYKVIVPLLTTFDRPLQKKSNKALMHMCTMNKRFIEANGAAILDHLCSILSQCDPAAKKYRLATLDALVQNAHPEAIQRNISHMIGEGLISAREVSSEARENAIEFLDTLFKRVTFGSTSLDMDTIEPNPELVTAACNFMRALISGLGGTSPEMISATVEVVTHLLHKYLHFFEPVIENLFRTVILLIDYPNITVVLSCFKFLKSCLADLEGDFMEPSLRTIVPSIFNAISRHSRSLTKARFLLERMTVVFGAEVIENLTPDNHKRLIRSIQREMRRDERKKSEKIDNSSRTEAVHLDENLDLKATVMKDIDEEEDTEMTAILEGKDTEVSIEKSGKVVINLGSKRKRDEVNLDDFNEKSEMNDSDEDKEVVTTSFESRKRQRIGEDSSAMDDPTLTDPHAKHYLELRAKQRRRRDPTERISMGKEYRARKGRGDVKKGNLDPFAYLPLDPNQMNRRNRNKSTIFDKFSRETKHK